MNFNLLPASSIFFFVIIIISGLDHLPTSFCIDDSQYEACAGKFQCANIPNLDYPFWGNDRPKHCGHPGFQLNCQGVFPLITIQSTPYRVLGIDIGTLIITVATQDLLNDTCPTYLYQTSFDYTLFKHPPNDQNLTLYYGCPRVPLQALRPYEFDCTVNGTDSFSYFVTTQVNNLVPNLNGVTCSNNIIVPVNGTAAQTLSVPTASRKDLQAVLAGGFELEWEANDSNCNSCARSGGRCGYNSTYSSFTCLCIDRPYALRCNETGDDGLTSNSKALAEVLNAGFNMNFSDPYTRQFLDYRLSGRQCGFDWNSSRPICICGHSFCNGAGNSASSPKTLGIVLPVIGAILTGICIGWLIFFCRRRRKWRYAQSSPVNAMSFWKARESSSHNIETFIRNYALTPMRYTYTDIKKMTNSFNDKLGQGGYGGVYKGKLSDGCLVAVKVLNETKSNGEEFINEVASISKTSHVNVVTLLGFCFERNRRALIYEFMPNKSLDKFIYANRSSNTIRSLDWKTLYQIAVGIARGLEYLHQGCNTRIVHFDIKPQNILLDEDFCPKISDFGLAKLCKKKESVISMLGVRGTAGFIAPEVFSRNFGRVSHKSDVYSYGMMVLEMAGASKNRKLAGVAHSSEVYFPDWIYEHLGGNDAELGIHGVTNDEEEGEAVKKMMLVSLWCIQTIPADRPSMSKVVEMLEGNLPSLQIPPKPLLHSPTRSAQDSYISLPLSSENIIVATNSISG